MRRAPAAVRLAHGVAEALLAGGRVDEDGAQDAGGVDLEDGAGHDVEPLVGDDEDVVEGAVEDAQRLGDGGATGRGRPPDVGGEAGRALDDVDAGEPQVGSDGVQGEEQLAAPAADVDDVRRALAVGEPAQRLGEHRSQRPVRRGREVPGGPVAPVEAGRTVEGLLPRVAPGHRVHPRHATGAPPE
ncbi:hypothetical protein [Phycicoccus sp. HDW14]|uniref:hypothetical protein n=1 Tax=Phycicoccus sp. HDW14 TaxID=2714941 RepID=UPI001F0D659E|nr:hypothetical protein [Phycicoccus sp. HDW14]